MVSWGYTRSKRSSHCLSSILTASCCQAFEKWEDWLFSDSHTEAGQTARTDKDHASGYSIHAGFAVHNFVLLALMWSFCFPWLHVECMENIVAMSIVISGRSIPVRNWGLLMQHPETFCKVFWNGHCWYIYILQICSSIL